MLIYMTHPKHGVHIVYNPAELEHAQKHGWSVREDKPAEQRQQLTIKKGGKCQSPPIPSSKPQ